MSRISLSWVVVLGLLSAIGPLCTDFYLPALPEITQQLSATGTQTQLSLTAALIGLGLGQLFFGPLSDRIGRKKPLALSLLLFIFSSAMCAITYDIHLLIAWRFLQGFAGAGKIEFLRCHVSAFQWSRAAVLRALDQAAGRRLVALILPRRSSVRS